MRTRILVSALLAIGLALSGCSGKGTLAPRTAPETDLFIQGAVDTVNHVVHLYWFGTDPDGTITGFEWRLLNPSAPTDTGWKFTTVTDSLFTVFSPNGATDPVFEVRAIDNDGLRDPTPAAQHFFFKNEPPTVTIGFYPQARDTTYASLTFSFVANDPDGDSRKMRFRVWLDGNEANPRVYDVPTITIPTADFLVGGQIGAGIRTVFVQPIDDGGRAGDIVSRSWVVRPTTPGSEARMLLIDDVPAANPLAFRTDTLWQNAVERTFPPGSYSILRFEFTQPFRSPLDAQQTFSLYDAVAWYRGTETTFSTVLRDMQDGISGALENGHSFVLEGLNLIDAQGRTGPLRQSFMQRWYDTDFLYKYFQSGMSDSSAEWGSSTNKIFRSADDSLRIAAIFRGLRGFAVKDTHNVLLWARDSTISPPNDFDIPIALSVPHPNGARAIVITFPVVATSVPTTSFPQRASIFLNKVMASVRKPGP